jgi:Putative prokaryotic signal transducing protein
MEDSYELQRLITIATFSTPWEAQLAQARLGAEGLHSLIANEHVIRMVALSNAVGGVQLKVREQDAAAATEVLQRLAPLPEIYLVAAAGEAALGAPGTDRADRADRAGGPMPATAATAAAFPADAADAAPGRSCPACGSADLQPERSSRRLLGMLPVSRRGYRCGDCGILWGVEEIGGQARTGPDPAPPDAGASLAGEDTALHTFARFHTPWEAHLARSFLESEGLRCCVLEERLPAVQLLSAEPVAYNRLEVRRADAGRAAEILARAWSGQLLAAVPDPDAGEP